MVGAYSLVFRRMDFGFLLLVVCWSNKLDEIAVGVFHHCKGHFCAGDESWAFSEDFNTGFFKAFEGGLGAVYVNSQVAESKAACDVGLVAHLTFVYGGLHELDCGRTIGFAEGEFFNDDFFSGAEP